MIKTERWFCLLICNFEIYKTENGSLSFLEHKKEIDLVKQIAKRELNATDNYIDNENKWLYNSFGDKTYFALYSTAHTDEPTVLYACKGERAEFEYKFLIRDILGKVDVDGYTNEQTRVIERLSIDNQYDKSDDSIDNRRPMGRGSDAGDVGLYSENPRRRPSEALLDCLRNIREIYERDGRIRNERINNSNDNPQFAVTSQMQQLRYNPE